MADKELVTDRHVSIFRKKGIFDYIYYFNFILKAHRSKKIIIHGLFDSKIIKILFFMPWLLKKCYWVMWGGDLYRYRSQKKTFKKKINEFYRRNVIRKMGNFISYTKGEYENAKKWYGAKGNYYRSFMYVSNLYHEVDITPPDMDYVSILVGNSADPENNHISVFSLLEKYRHDNIRIYAPLTYGKSKYAEMVIKVGREIFGDKFYPITEHVKFSEYLKFLSHIDIAVFGHDRQQAMGTIRTLLGMGKKVYMKQDLTSAIGLCEDGIKTFSLNEISLEKNFPEQQRNMKNIKSCFSEKNLYESLAHIFN